MPNPVDEQAELSLPLGALNPVPDHRCSSTANLDFFLDKGEIYQRPNTPEEPKALVRGDLVSLEAGPDALKWKLFDDKGFPYDANLQSLLADNEQIVEIAAASNILVAVSNLDRVYLYKPTEYTRPLHWESKLGAPDFMADELFLPQERRAWAFSCSVCKKDEIRDTNFIHPSEIVSYAKDGNGINFDFGFTPTIYVLDKEGRKIVYWDSGLPASFSRGFLVPDGMQGLSISAAGSTVFLSAIDAEGKLHFFTRMIDYEINGACPGLKVSYTDTPVVQPPNGTSFFLGQGVRKLPLDGWVEHKIDDLPPLLTHKICIRLNDKGDDARELRILGQNAALEWGYYSKNIRDNNWQFIVNKAATPAENENLQPTPFNPAYKNSQKMSYEGKLLVHRFPHIVKVEDNSKTTIELKDFHPFLSDAEPLSILISHPGETPQTLKIHAVDAWGLHYHHKDDEELIGSVDGEPKALVGTLILSDEQIELTKNPHSKIGAYIKAHFLEYNGETKAIPIIADNSMVAIKLNHCRCSFKRTLTEEEIAGSFYMRKAMNPAWSIRPNNLEESTQLLDEVKGCLYEIKSTFSQRRIADGEFAFINAGTIALRPLASGFFKVVHCPEDPTYQQAVADLKLLLQVHIKATAYSALGKTQPVGYERAVSILENRIKQVEQVVDHYAAERRKNKFASLLDFWSNPSVNEAPHSASQPGLRAARSLKDENLSLVNEITPGRQF